MAAGVPVASFDCAVRARARSSSTRSTGCSSARSRSPAWPRPCCGSPPTTTCATGWARRAPQASGSTTPHALAERWVGIFADARARRAGRGRLAARAPDRPPPAAPDPTVGLDVAGVTPAQARHDALAQAVDAARAASDTLAGDPGPRVDPAADGGAADARARRVPRRPRRRPTRPAYLSLRDPAENGWPERRGPVAALAADLRRGMTSVRHLEPWPRCGAACSGRAAGRGASSGRPTPDGDLVAPRRNPYADRMPAALATVDVEVEGVRRCRPCR